MGILAAALSCTGWPGPTAARSDACRWCCDRKSWSRIRGRAGGCVFTRQDGRDCSPWCRQHGYIVRDPQPSNRWSPSALHSDSRGPVQVPRCGSHRAALIWAMGLSSWDSIRLWRVPRNSICSHSTLWVTPPLRQCPDLQGTAAAGGNVRLGPSGRAHHGKGGATTTAVRCTDRIHCPWYLLVGQTEGPCDQGLSATSQGHSTSPAIGGCVWHRNVHQCPCQAPRPHHVQRGGECRV